MALVIDVGFIQLVEGDTGGQGILVDFNSCVFFFPLLSLAWLSLWVDQNSEFWTPNFVARVLVSL